jgi:hypothetical protein
MVILKTIACGAIVFLFEIAMPSFVYLSTPKQHLDLALPPSGYLKAIMRPLICLNVKY